MKLIFRLFIFILLCSLSHSIFAQDYWSKIESPTTNDLNTLFFTDSLRGYVAGDSGLILYTSNGGVSWVQQQSNTNRNIIDLFFLNEDLGWAVAWSEGILPFVTFILKTTDGGNNWTANQFRQDNILMYSIYFLDSLKGFTGGNPGAIFKTTDGGANWDSAAIAPAPFAYFPILNFNFYNDEYGFACGGAHDIAGITWKTTNGGEYWVPIDTAYTPPDELWDIYFVDSANVIGVGGDPELFGVGILRSSDAGETWDYDEIGLIGMARAISFRTDYECWAPVPIPESIIESKDSARTWTFYNAPENTSIYDIVFTDSLTGYGVGEQGAIIKYNRRPIISNVKRNKVEVGYNDAVTVSAQIIDLNGMVSEAKLLYRINLGSYIELEMNNTGENLWEAIIPAQFDSTIIDFFIVASDEDNNITSSPVDTSKVQYFYLVINRQLSIQDVQFNPFGSGISGYNGYEVTVRGIVTADTSDFKANFLSSPATIFIQNNNGPWSGIKVSGLETLNTVKGDEISVTGIVIENQHNTEITGIDNAASLTVHSSGNFLPNPNQIATSEINLQLNHAIQAEQWESVSIIYADIVVTDENADGLPGPDEGPGGNRNFGEILVADSSMVDTRVELQDGNHQYHNFWEVGLDTIPNSIRVRAGDRFDEIIGIVIWTNGNYKIFPRNDSDFVGYINELKKEKININNYSLSQNYPNPFNSVTKIDYFLPSDGKVTLQIFNVLGEEIAKPLNGEIKSPGNHSLYFDASNLTSGLYFYRLVVNDFMEVKKMLLLK